MVLSTGFYRTQSTSFYLIQDPNDSGFVVLTTKAQSERSTKLRRDKQLWLSVDDGLVGRYGNPDHLRVRIGDTIYRIWVEQRGRDQFGLIPTDESGAYSNKFIGVTKDGAFTVEDEWGPDNGSVWVVSSTWGGQPGV